jgi:hypothetical protein
MICLALLAIVVFAAAGVAMHPPADKPVLNVMVLGYTNWHGFLCARVRVTNVGSCSVSYDSAATAPGGWLKTESASGWAEDGLGAFTGSLVVLDPGSNVVFSAVMPTKTLRWQFGFSVRAASLRERAFWEEQRGWLGRLPVLGEWPRLLPDRRGAEQELRSEIFDLRVPPSSTHNEAMHLMSGHHVSSVFGRPGRPLIGDLDR